MNRTQSVDEEKETQLKCLNNGKNHVYFQSYGY